MDHQMHLSIVLSIKATVLQRLVLIVEARSIWLCICEYNYIINVII